MKILRRWIYALATPRRQRADNLRRYVKETYSLLRSCHDSPTPSGDPRDEATIASLQTCYEAIGKRPPTVLNDLPPFLFLNESVVADAQAEYFVLQAIPAEARRDWLSDVLSDAVRGMLAEIDKAGDWEPGEPKTLTKDRARSARGLLPSALRANPPWLLLLDRSLQNQLAALD